MSRCRICEQSIRPFMSFGKMPIANGFLTPEEIAGEYFFELAPAYCEHCGMVQLVEQPAPEIMFNSNYAFFSSTSRHMALHFERFAQGLIDGVLAGRDDPFVVELGSNTGPILRHLKDRGIRHLGVEPSSNVAEVARAEGIKTLCEFFDTALGERIAAEHGQADAILAANVMCHIADLHSVARGVRRLLKPDGVLVFEEPYLGDMIAKTSYDQIYDEHVFIFSATSVANAFGRHGFALINAEPQSTHGGSMRYTLAAKNAHPANPAVAHVLEREREQGLNRVEAYERFRKNCENSRARLMGLLEDLRGQNKRVVGYGATSKSTTVMNYCGITPAHISFISDTTPIKQGKLSPGAHVPVRPYEEFRKDYPDYALLFAWNHSTEIREKEADFVDRGGKWIYYVPKVEIIA